MKLSSSNCFNNIAFYNPTLHHIDAIIAHPFNFYWSILCSHKWINKVPRNTWNWWTLFSTWARQHGKESYFFHLTSYWAARAWKHS